jgi:phytoene dehydrogenase-like protein
VVADPLRRPGAAVGSLLAPVGTPADKVRVALLVAGVRRGPAADLLRRPETSTRRRLESAGFSSAMIEAFWRPLVAGIQLDPDLEVSSRRFDVVLRMLAVGDAAVPADGMGAVTAQLAAGLPSGTVRLDAPVDRLEGTAAVLASGERVDGRAVVVATEAPEARRLLGGAVDDPGSSAVACCWFAAAVPPPMGATLALDGTGAGPAGTVAVLSAAQPSYAPPGRSLVAAAVPGPVALDPGTPDRVADQVAGWFGSTAREWELLRTDVIAHGQPRQVPPFRPRRRVDLGGGRFVCGDHRDTASLQGALFSGGRTARSVVRSLRG